MMSRYKSCQWIRLVKYYALCEYMWCLFYRVGHVFCVWELFWSIQRRNPPCNAKNNLRAGLIVIEAWFRGYWGSPGLGVLGQPDYILWLDCWTMKIQDWRLHPVSGWDSPWRGRQAWKYGYVDLLPCNRLYVTLAPSGVYINWRV